MKTQSAARFVAVLGALALASCASPPETQRLQVSSSFRPDSSLSGQVFQEINRYRQSKGCQALERHSGLDRLAQQHCEYLRKHRGSFSLSGRNVSHFGFEGRALYARERFQMENISENVAACKGAGASPAPTLLSLWKNSKDHHKNLLDDWTHTGVGTVVDSDGTVFSTQLFSTSYQSHLATRERFNRF